MSIPRLLILLEFVTFSLLVVDLHLFPLHSEPRKSGDGSMSDRQQGGSSSRPGPKPGHKSDSGGVVVSSRGIRPEVGPPPIRFVALRDVGVSVYL